MFAALTSRHPRLAQVRQRRGVIIVLTAFLMIVLFAMIAFALDIGFLLHTDTELQRAVDAGALAGAGTIVQGADIAQQVVKDIIKANLVNSEVLQDSDIEIHMGDWNETSQSFVESSELPSAVRVIARRTDQPYFFAPVIDNYNFSLEAEAIAMFRPREIVLVLDYSASMSDDSEFDHIGIIGQSNVEANMLQIYNDLGAPTFGSMQWNPVYISSTNTTTIKNTLGISSTPYPYPGGSWNDYISYVMNDASVNSAGYRKCYGYMTWISYLLDKRTTHAETPDLWMTHEQPITALKNAVTVFLAYLQEVNTDDRLSLVVYTATDNTATVESSLTSDFDTIEDISRHRQAGHYNRMTNIGAGLNKARIELQQHARPGSFKMIVLMTDGIPNLPGSSSQATTYLLDQADECAALHYPVVTICLGAGADTDLLQQVADDTGGVAFVVPGSSNVDDYEEQLKAVFREIADSRPLRMVK